MSGQESRNAWSTSLSQHKKKLYQELWEGYLGQFNLVLVFYCVSVTGSSSVLKASCPYSEVIDILCFLRPASSAASNLLGKDLSHVIVVMVRPKKKK